MTQHGPRTVSRHFALAAIYMVMAARLSFGQAAEQTASNGEEAGALTAFDVVSVKPVPPGTKLSTVGFQYTPDGVHGRGLAVSMMIRAAYGGFMKMSTEDSVTGLPVWTKSETFDVQGKMSPEQAAEFARLNKDDQEQRREAMLRSLLEDRFNLRVHREPKQVPDYELVVAKGGPKFKESDSNPTGLFKESDSNPTGLKDRDGKPLTGSILQMRGLGHVQAQALSMEQLANFLGQQPVGVGRMVRDKTGLTARYSFSLNWKPDLGLGAGTMGGLPVPPPPSSASPVGAADDSLPSILTALQEQLGLKLQPGIGTIDVVVVDHVQRPSVD